MGRWNEMWALGCTYVYVPHALVNVIRARPAAGFRGIAAKGYVPLLRLKVPDRSGEEASGDEVQQTRRSHEEQLQLGSRSAPG